MKHTNPERFHEVRNQFKESRFHVESCDPQWDRRLRIGPKRACRAIRTNAAATKKIPETFLARIETVMEDCFNFQRKMVQPHEPMAILCHGDFLRNNIAFKYASIDDVLQRICSLLIYLNRNRFRTTQPVLWCLTFKRFGIRRRWAIWLRLWPIQRVSMFGPQISIRFLNVITILWCNIFASQPIMRYPNI